MALDPKTGFERLRGRVLAVARLHRLCALGVGSGKIVWRVGLPLLALALLQSGVGLSFYIRALILPAAAILALVWAWRHVLRPLRARYGLTRAAMLVEAARPDLRSRVVSALELYPEIESGRAGFDPAMLGALVVYAQESTAEEDFTQVIDRRPARRHLGLASVTAVLWLTAFLMLPGALRAALGSMVSAWGEVGDLVQKASGARIELLALDRPAYLVGSDIKLGGLQKGFHRDRMELCLRPAEGGGAWQRVTVAVRLDGQAHSVVTNAHTSLEYYFTTGVIESPHGRAVVTERPRLVRLSLEYDLPDYVRRAPVVQPNSDGTIQGLFGSTVIVSLEANKNLAGAVLTAPFLKDPLAFSLGGRYARGILRLDDRKWLADPAAACHETYRLQLKDEYGFVNADAERDFALDVVKDAPPTIALVGVPQRSSDEEPHILEDTLATVVPQVQARDDYGIKKVTVYARLEDLESNADKGTVKRERQFALPVVDLPRLRVLALTELGAKVGDRIVYWAEAEDAYDLEPDKGPHKVRTPNYRFAVVSQEAMFADIRYLDTWSVDWYDKKKVATLSQRAAPARMAPESEPAAKVAAKLLDAPPVVDSLRGVDQQLVQDYYDSLSSGK